MSSYRIASPEIDTTKQGTEARISFYVLEADRAAYTPLLYSVPYDPGTGSSWLPSAYQSRGITVRNVTVNPLCSGLSWQIDITANNYPGTKNLLDDITWTYPQTELYFDPSWYGIIKASANDDWTKVFQTRTANKARTSPTALAIGKYNSYVRFLKYDSTESTISSQTGPTTIANLVQAGHLRFKNAKPAIYLRQITDADGMFVESSPSTGYAVEGFSENTKGSAVYTDSPFDTETYEPDINWVGQKIPMLTGQITYYVRNRRSEVAIFQGVNGANGFPSRCRPFNSDAGKWMAKNQTISDAVDEDGNEYLRITRTMWYAPGSLIWDADKNGGTWSW